MTAAKRRDLAKSFSRNASELELQIELHATERRWGDRASKGLGTYRRKGRNADPEPVTSGVPGITKRSEQVQDHASNGRSHHILIHANRADILGVNLDSLAALRHSGVRQVNHQAQRPLQFSNGWDNWTGGNDLHRRRAFLREDLYAPRFT